MRRLFVSVSSLAIAVLSASSAHSQIASVASANQGGVLAAPALDVSVIRHNMSSFTDCVLLRDFKAVTDFLAKGTYNQGGNQEVRVILTRNEACNLGDPIKFNQVIFAGVAAEAIYRASGFRFGQNKTALSEASTTSPIMCIVARRPEDVDHLFATTPETSGERAALLALEVTVEECKTNLNRDPAILRSSLAAGGFPTAWTIMKAKP